ncbi:MAG: response regulator, partial [Chloroflexi bacterium]
MDPIILLLVLAVLFVAVLALVALRIVRRRRAGAAKKPDRKTKDNKKSGARTSPKKLTRTESPPPPTRTADSSTKILGGSTSPGSKLPPQPKQGYAPEGEKIKILIVDDNTGTRENVSRLLYFENDLEVIGQAVNGRQGVEMAAELKPHIVLMDINMPDMDGITATQKMSLEAPYSQVIIMSVQSDQHYMKQAMAAGARDFQPKPFTSEELVSCIRRVYNIGLPVYQQFETINQPAAPSKSDSEVSSEAAKTRCPVIAVFSPKGGAGTSALAANLAVAMHQQQGETVLMDGALQFGDISVHLNTRSANTVADLIHEGALEVDLVDEILAAHKSGLKLLLAPGQPELAEAISGAMVTEIIGGLKERFNAVLVDTASKLNDVTLAVLDAADLILVVTTPDLTSIKSAKLFLELTEQLEFDTNRLQVVINRANQPGGIPVAKIEKVLQLQQSYSVPYDPKLYFLLNRGAPICLEEPAAPSATAIISL